MQEKFTSYQTILEFTLLLIIFLSPFDYGGLNLETLTIITLSSLFLFFLYLRIVLQRGEESFLFSPLIFSLLFFLLIVISSIFHSIDSFISGYGFIKFFNYALIFFILINNFKKLSSLLRIIRLLFAYCTLLSLFGLFQYFTGIGNFPLVIGSRAHSLFITPNTFAAYLILLIPLMCTSFLTSSDKRTRFVLLAIIILNFSAFLATYSRSGWLAFAISLPLFFLILLRRRKIFLLSRLLTLVVTILMITALFFGHNRSFMKGSLNERVESLHAPLEVASAQSRFKYWKSSIKVIKKYPFFGTGIETFYLIYPSVKDLSFRGIKHFYVHNDYLQISSELGIIGLFALLYLLFIYFRLLFRCCFSLRDSSSTALAVGILIGSLALFIHSFFEFNFYIQAIMIILSLYFGLSSIMAVEINFGRRRKITFPKLLPGKILNPLILLLFLGLSSQVIRPYLAQVSTAKARSSIKKEEYRKAARILEKVVSLSPLTANYHRNLGRIYHLLSSEDLLYSEKAEKEYKRAIELSPYDAENYSLLGIFYLESSSLEKQQKSIYYLKKATQFSPIDESYNVELALAYKKLKRPKEAIEQFLIYDRFHPEDRRVKIFLAECYLSLKNREKAKGE